MAKPTILTVDDDLVVAQAITRDLRARYGAEHRIVRTSSGAEALNVLEELARRDRPVALIVSDHRMPEMTGIQLLRAIRSRDADVPVVLVTGSPDLESAMQAVRLGALLYLTKPIDMEELKQVMARAQKYPNVKIAMDHIGFPRPEVLPETFGLTPEHYELAKHKNVYYKLTNFLVSEMEAGAKNANKPMVELKPFVEHMVKTFGTDHLMWGSDYGNVEVDDVQYTKNMIAATSALSAKERSAFFYDTAKAVFVPGGRGKARS